MIANPCLKTPVGFTSAPSEETIVSDLFLWAQTGGGGQIEQIAQRFGVDWSHLIAQTISFCIVAALLYRLRRTSHEASQLIHRARTVLVG